MQDKLLEVSGLTVSVGATPIFHDVDLTIERGESYVLFGPNGSGKSSLVNAIMGLPEYEVLKGSIRFEGNDISSATIDERARLGMRLAFQLPPEITGIKLSDMLKICLGIGHKDPLPDEVLSLANRMRMSKFLDRDINMGFSGGERKRAEALQMLVMKPKLMLLDEPDSGVDAESLDLIGTLIQEYLESSGASALIITHQGQILESIKAKKACVFMDKIVYCHSSPQEIIQSIREKGYDGCEGCDRRNP